MRTSTELIALPLREAELPLCAEAVSAWFGVLTELGVRPLSGVGAADARAWWRRGPTLSSLVAEGLVDADALQRAAAELPTRHDLPPAVVVDRFLVPALLLGLGRFARQASHVSAELRDWVAVVLAVEAWRPLVQPDDGPPELAQGPGSHIDLVAARRLPGARWLARQFGLASLVAAVAHGRDDRAPVNAAQLALAARLTREPATPSELLDPAATFDAEDAAWLEDVVDLACVRRRRAHGWPRAHLTLPAGGGLRLDLTLGTLTPLAPTSLGQATAEGWLEPPPAGLPLPPGVCAALRRAGWRTLVLKLHEIDAIGDALELLFDLCDGETSPQVIAGDGFELRPG